MKKAFSMVELIFVIVIIGILAVIAIPKLLVNRNDAKVSKELNQLSTYLNDITAYYIATGNVSVDHTNVELECFASNVTIDNDILSLSITNEENDKDYCNGAQQAAADKKLTGNKVVTFSGNIVRY